MPKKYIDPYMINRKDFPVVVMSCDLIGFIPWAIRAITKDNWNHVMESRKCGAFVSQNLMYAEIAFSSYMNRYHKLKIWTIKDMSEIEKIQWNASINRDLGSPWYSRLYDFLGVLGHLLGIRWLNAPYRSYCSERVRKHLVEVFGFDIIKHATPAEIDDFLTMHPRGVLLGFWDAEMDTGLNDVVIGGNVTCGC